MRKFQSGFTAFELVFTVLVVAGIGGWIANIVKLVGSNFEPLGGMVIARIIGVFIAPLGSILGFL